MLTVKFDLLKLERHMNLLDLGCGQGRHSFEALKYVDRIFSLDKDEQSLKNLGTMLYLMRQEGELGSEKRPAIISADALELPFIEESIDRTIISEVLEHVPNDEVVLRELKRIMKPGAILAITVPRFYPELINWALSDKYHLVEGGHIRIYRKKDLFSKIELHGFKIFAYHYAHGLHSPYWWLKCFVGVDNEDNKYVSKYKRFLERQITNPGKIDTILEAICAPIMGKSLVVYAKKLS